jgi:hypothetical protein
VRVIDISDGTESQPTSLIVRWDAGDRTVDPADIEAEYDRIRGRFDNVNIPRSTMERMLAPELSEDRPVADRFPAYSDLFVARDGSLWVKEYPRPRGPAATRGWLAFDPDDALRCRATTPLFEVFEFGPDWILAAQTDELGVERVVLFGVDLEDPG